MRSLAGWTIGRRWIVRAFSVFVFSVFVFLVLPLYAGAGPFHAPLDRGAAIVAGAQRVIDDIPRPCVGLIPSGGQGGECGRQFLETGISFARGRPRLMDQVGAQENCQRRYLSRHHNRPDDRAEAWAG